MPKTSTERSRELRTRRRLLNQKPYTVWITKEEKAIIKPIIEDKLKELREKDSKK